MQSRVLNKIKKLRQMISEDSSDLEIIEIALDQTLADAKSRKMRRASKRKSSNPRYINRSLKESVHHRSNGQCEYISPLNSKRCQARRHLQIDHIKPLALGGKSDKSNLRHLCFAHNQRSAIKLLGVEKMEQFTVAPQ
ncbi:MAG: HNH endonuclease [Bdellovibrionales bacterium]|nr:HNH endonuclease [Bdellovibrionales bacterium]MBT3525108.1 HNH endonuclease [Bdellovibrionales bacterium]MBT7668561.1 HNH endonuclease [Bdellovibrionales bacterium]MBT7767932.1 HNH endonuclease [Bdellovibrionales bacterium]